MKTEEARRKHREYMRKWRAAHPENKEYQREYFAAYSTPERAALARQRAAGWYANNRTRALENVRRRAEQKPDLIRETAQRWIEKNKEAHRAYQRAYQMRRLALKKQVTMGPVDFDALLRAADGVCALCGQRLEGKWHFDHIVPLARGGEHSQVNLQVTHPRCNRRKSARVEWEHLF